MSLVNRLGIASSLGMMLVLSSASYGVVLAPGVIANAAPGLGVSGANTTQSQPFATSNYTGSLQSWVYTDTSANPLGGLTFVYQVNNDALSANALQRLTVNGFAGYATDVSYVLGTGSVVPSFNDRDATGGVVGWDFKGPPVGLGTIAAGTSTNYLVVRTNASASKTVIANISNGAVSPVNAFGPAGSITPEPTTLAVIGGAVALAARRRKA